MYLKILPISLQPAPLLGIILTHKVIGFSHQPILIRHLPVLQPCAGTEPIVSAEPEEEPAHIMVELLGGYESNASSMAEYHDLELG